MLTVIIVERTEYKHMQNMYLHFIDRTPVMGYIFVIINNKRVGHKIPLFCIVRKHYLMSTFLDLFSISLIPN
jgi:hypothetical protein